MNYKALQWRITHGEPELADDWLLGIAYDLIRGKTLDSEDTDTLAKLLITAAYHKVGARLFNDMKPPDKRRNVTGKMRLYFVVEGYRDIGMTRLEAIPPAARDCGYLEGCKTDEDEDEPLRRASNDYKEAQKQFMEFIGKTLKELQEYPPPPKTGG